MIEYRTERVAPRDENEAIETLAVFGWHPLSSQEIYNESTEVVGVDVKIYGDGFVDACKKGWTGKDGEINVEQRTNITNYVAIKFARDTEMPMYEELKELNEQYDLAVSIKEPTKPVKTTATAAVLLGLAVFALVLADDLALKIIFPVAAAIFIILCVIFWIRFKRELSFYHFAQKRSYEIFYEAADIIKEQ